TGKVTKDFGAHDVVFSAAIQSDSKIVAVGFTSSSTNSDFALARYNADGTMNADFGGGKFVTDFGADELANGVAIQTDGKIVAAGFTQFSDERGVLTRDFALARYNPDGSLDTTFNSDGKVTTDFGSNDGANSVAIQADGKIVAAGFGGAQSGFALARYN